MNLGQSWGKYTVVGIKNIVHGKFYPNTDVLQIVALAGARGAKATAHVAKSGMVGKLQRNFGYFEGYEILDGRSEEEKAEAPELIAII